MSLSVSSLTQFNNNNSFINRTSSVSNNLYKKQNYVNDLYNKTNSYSSNLNSTNNVSNFNETYSKKLSELKQYTSDSKDFHSDFVEKFSDLKKTSNSLKANGSGSVFQANTYGSNDTSVVSISKTGSSDTNDYKVEVNQLATGKSISTDELASSGNELVEYGSISINNGQKSYSFDVNNNDALNNKDAINKIAEKVNKAGIGVKATLEEKDGKSSLKLESTTTGENSKLSVAFENNLSKELNVKSTQEGKNAKYKVNDAEYSSESNSINLSNAVKATLNNVGKAEVSSNNIDSKKIVDAVKTFADDYNKVVNFLSDNSSKSTELENLADSFGLNKYSSSSLEDIGVTVGSNGKLSVNEKNLKFAIGKDYKHVKDVLGDSSGTANQTYTKVQDAMNNSKNLYPSFQFTSSDSSIHSYNNINNIYGQYNSMYSSGVFLNSLI